MGYAFGEDPVPENEPAGLLGSDGGGTAGGLKRPAAEGFG